MKKIMAVLFVSLIGFACNKSTPKSHLDLDPNEVRMQYCKNNPLAETCVENFTGEEDLKKLCESNPAAQMCTDIGEKKIVENIAANTFGQLDLKLNTPQEGITEFDNLDTRMRFDEMGKWEKGWNILVPSADSIKTFTHSNTTWQVNPETGVNLRGGRLIRKYYDQNGNQILDTKILKGSTSFDNGMMDNNVKLANIENLDAVTKIYKVAFFGEGIESVNDFENTTHYYIMPVIRLHRLAS